MDEQKKTAADSWTATQNNYWDAWLNLTRQTFTETKKQDVPGGGSNGLIKWWEALTLAAPPTTRQFAQRLVELTAPYFELAEQFAGTAIHENHVAIEKWLDELTHTFTTMGEKNHAPTNDTLRTALAFWELPLDTWRLAATALMPASVDFLRPNKTQGLETFRREIKDHVDRFLSIPAIGYTRESQEQHQQLIRLTLDYANALQAYQFAFAQVGIRSVEELREQINAESPEPKIHSLRELYDVWVDTCERVYLDFAFSEEHTRLYGHLVNTLTSLKRHASILLDDVLESMNLPTRREIDTMHRRSQELRREQHALRAELAAVHERLEHRAPAKNGRTRKAKHH